MCFQKREIPYVQIDTLVSSRSLSSHVRRRLASSAAGAAALAVAGVASASSAGLLDTGDDDLLSLLAGLLAGLEESQLEEDSLGETHTLADWLALDDGGLSLAGIHAAALAGLLALVLLLLLDDDDLLGLGVTASGLE